MSESADDRQLRARPPLDSVLVATDFSSGAAAAAARSLELPLAVGARLSLLHVLPDALPERLRAGVEEEAREHLLRASTAASSTLSSVGRGDVRVESRLCRGEPYVEIIRHARSEGVELVVLGRHGRRRLKDMFIGSTASRVVRNGDIAVLVVSRSPTGPYRRPLVAVDLDDTSRSVVDLALRVAGSTVSTAAMVHAYHVPFEGFLSPAASIRGTTELREEYGRQARSKTAGLVASLADSGVEWSVSVVRGDPRSVILLDAAWRTSDLLAIGTHGRTGLAHALVGSVAEWVIENATIDLLVARPARVTFELP